MLIILEGVSGLLDTYDRRCQLGASRRRFEDASALHSCKRWGGAVYMGGYAIECSLKSLICYVENANIAVPERMRYTPTERSLAVYGLGQLTCTSSE